jgi:hypothetical protein
MVRAEFVNRFNGTSREFRMKRLQRDIKLNSLGAIILYPYEKSLS